MGLGGGRYGSAIAVAYSGPVVVVCNYIIPLDFPYMYLLTKNYETPQRLKRTVKLNYLVHVRLIRNTTVLPLIDAILSKVTDTQIICLCSTLSHSLQLRAKQNHG